MSDAPADPNLAALVRRLPTMRNGKPRKFRHYCECFEWTFNQFYNVHVRSFASAADRVRHIENFARALWHYQNPRVTA